jgi:hypothetical protein
VLFRLMPRIDEVLRKAEGKLKNEVFQFFRRLEQDLGGFCHRLYFTTTLQPSIRMLSDADKLRPSLSSALSETERSEVSDNVCVYEKLAKSIWAEIFVKNRSLIHAVVRCNEKFLFRR